MTMISVKIMHSRCQPAEFESCPEGDISNMPSECHAESLVN